ncbi:MAG: CPBP family intramembrane metalloprotease [Bacteroidia bacterium]
MSTRLPAHSFLLAARRGENKIWYYLAGILLVFMGSLIGSVPYSALVALNARSGNPADMLDLSSAGIHPAVSLLLIMLSLAVIVPVLFFTVQYIHKRPFRTLFSGERRLRRDRMLFAAGLWLALMIVFEGVAWALHPDNYTFSFDAGQFFPTLLVALVMVPLQTSAEELLFRSYLMQGIGLGTGRPWVALLLTSAGFGLLHIANPEVAAFGPWLLLYYMGFGVAMGLATLMDEGVELALGVHAANNLYGALVVTFPSSALQTPALFTLKAYPALEMTLIWLVATLVFLGIVSKKYGWNDWRKLLERLAPAQEAQAADLP